MFRRGDVVRVQLDDATYLLGVWAVASVGSGGIRSRCRCCPHAGVYVQSERDELILRGKTCGYELFIRAVPEVCFVDSRRKRRTWEVDA